MGYDPLVVLKSIDENVILVNGLMSICMVAVVIYYINAIKVAKSHKAHPIPFAACGWYTIHDFYFAAEWDKWSSGYQHWWLQLWGISCFFYAFLELFMCYLVYKYGREELMPKLTQRQFGYSLVAAFLGIGVFWVMVKGILHDDLWLIAFAVTTFWPQVWNTQLIIKRQAMKGISRTMLWCMLASPFGMLSSWYFLDPYFRSPIWVAFSVVTLAWAVFNLWLSTKYPVYVPAKEPVSSSKNIYLA